MRSKTAQRILEETPQEIKNRVRKETNHFLKMENMLGQFFGCDSAYYPQQEVEDITRAIEIGFNSAKKEFKKKLRDKYNALNSQYTEGMIPKMGRHKLTEEAIKLEGKVELLRELIKYVCSNNR